MKRKDDNYLSSMSIILQTAVTLWKEIQLLSKKTEDNKFIQIKTDPRTYFLDMKGALMRKIGKKGDKLEHINLCLQGKRTGNSFGKITGT